MNHIRLSSNIRTAQQVLDAYFSTAMATIILRLLGDTHRQVLDPQSAALTTFHSSSARLNQLGYLMDIHQSKQINFGSDERNKFNSYVKRFSKTEFRSFHKEVASTDINLREVSKFLQMIANNFSLKTPMHTIIRAAIANWDVIDMQSKRLATYKVMMHLMGLDPISSLIPLLRHVCGNALLEPKKSGRVVRFSRLAEDDAGPGGPDGTTGGPGTTSDSIAAKPVNLFKGKMIHRKKPAQWQTMWKFSRESDKNTKHRVKKYSIEYKSEE